MLRLVIVADLAAASSSGKLTSPTLRTPDRSPLLEPFEDETSFANLAGPGAMQARLLRDGPSQRNSGIIVDSQPVRGARRPQGDQSERANIPPEFLESLYKAALGRFERTPLARPLVSGSGPTRSLNAGLAAAAPAKRVENSRWNNLRGMWGKRSLPTETGTTNIQELASQD